MSRQPGHVPVMVEEVLELLAPVPPGLVLDATVGWGGHAAAILSARPDCRLVGLDRDREAVAAAAAALARFGGRARVLHARFDALAQVVAGERTSSGEPLVAVLFDLGVSSHQLDTAERGFSYRRDAPLDMRMDTSTATTAADLVNTADERWLAGLFAEHGEGRLARRIARAIVTARPFETTGELADAVARAVPASGRRRGHPARRVFQALRCAVNEELELLAPALDVAISLLEARGRLVVLSYHSGEERIVKERLRIAETGGCRCPTGLPCACGAQPLVRVLTRGARLPSEAEVRANPRAQSARLRAAERLDATARVREG
ncbi:MAG TPA: 16S rRNA (cytosine(1402)-N(4))-methyltransferase RsmH [Acidimicrobiales bacterium]|nr:16S rRNA (cytosine(1402)-N(4))-methyltransferase RsmH [Acidimicrobiales bacterium]